MTKTKDLLRWAVTVLFAVLFVLVLIGMVRTMNANDAQFDVPHMEQP